MTVKTHYIKMLSTRKGADEDNHNLVLTFFKGKCYWMGAELYKMFIADKFCEDAKEEKEERAQKSAPENKAHTGAKENKGK